MKRLVLLALCGLLLPAPAAFALGVAAVLENSQGFTAPCVAVGPGLTYCVHELERAGWVVKKEVGLSGLTLGNTAADDGVVTGVEPASAAATAGLQAGDVVTAVDGLSVRPTAARMAKQAMFGAKGRELHLTVRRDRETLERRLTLAQAPPPPGEPSAPNFLIGMHPIVNWEDRYIPCMGAGLAGPIAVATCMNGFKKHGYIAVGDLGGAGLTFSNAEPARAVVSAATTPAAEADIRAGDEIIAVDGQPLAGGVSDLATERLFGRIGEERRLAYRRGGTTRMTTIVLGARKAL